MKKSFCRLSLLLAWLIALIAMLTTLYGSEILNQAVCHLCWYQRICFYPLVIILGIAILRDDLSIGIYTIPLAILGVVFAVYQYILQRFPNFGPINLCGVGPDCRAEHIKLFGIFTYPLLSVVAGIVLTTLLFIALAGKNTQQ